CVLRRGGEQRGRLSRRAEFRRCPAAAGPLHLREQPVRVLGAARKEHGDRRRGRSCGELRLRRRRHQRQRRPRPVPADAGRARARPGDGPTLIECKTYRWHGHSEHDKAFYRTKEELAMWKSRDPIPTFTTYLKGLQILTDQQEQEVEARVKSTIDDAVEFAAN